MAEQVELDISLDKLKADIIAVRQELSKVPAATKEAFQSGAAQGVADAVGEIKKEYQDLKKSADILKGALKNATDPNAIKLYSKSVAELEAGMKKLENTAKVTGVNLKEANKGASLGKQVFEGFFGAFTKATIILAAIEAVKKFVTFAVGLSESTQKATRSFEAFLGSAEKAKGVVADLTGFAGKKLLNTDDVFQAGKGLLAFGEASDNLVPVLGRIADISAATGKNFNELVTIYGKARTSGVLYAEDINQLVDAGIPIIQEFAKQMGVSNDQVKKLASEGKISFEELQLAFFNLTAEGSKFAGQSALNALTLKGAWQGLVNDIAPAAQAIGDTFKGAFQIAIFKARELVGAVKELFGVSTAEQGAFFDIPKSTSAVDPVREKLEKEAAKRRAELAAKNSKAAAEAAAKAQRELDKLRIEAMKDGEEREIAVENLRFKELESALKKHHIDTSQAEEQHQINLQKIRDKFGIERILREAEEAEKRAAELAKLRAARGEFEEEQAKKNFDAAKKNLDQIKELQESEIDITEQNFKNFIALAEANGASKEELDRLELEFDNQVKEARLNAEIEFQQGLLAITDAGDTKQIELIKNKIALLQAQVQGLGISTPGGTKKPFNLFTLLGLDPDDPNFDKQKEALKNAAGEIIDVLRSLTAARTEEAEAAVKAADDKIQAAENAVEKAQDALDRELALAELGFASDVTNKQKELAAAEEAEVQAQAQRARALEEQKKAQKQQLILDAALQGSNILVSISNLIKTWSTLPFGVGLIAAFAQAASIFALIQSSRSKARALQAKEGVNGHVGERGIIVGPSHDAGGVPLEVEGGEFMYQDGKRVSVVNKKATAAHFGLLQAVNEDDRVGMAHYLQKLTGGVSRSAGVSSAGSSSGGTVGVSDKETQRLLAENNRLQEKALKAEESKVQYFDMGDYVLRVEKGKESRIKKQR